MIYTQAHHRVMQRVIAGAVLFHTACEVHAPGFSWRETDMPQDVLDILSELRVAHLVWIGEHQAWGSPVAVSVKGDAEMRSYEARTRTLERAS